MIKKSFLLPVILFFVLSILFVGKLAAQNSFSGDSLLTAANQYFHQGDEKKALEAYRKILQEDSLQYDALWHTSLLYSRIGFRMDDKQKQKTYYNNAFDIAKRTLNAYPDSGYSHFVYAVANGRISDISETEERIRISHIVKKHTLKATELMPDYAPAWLLLGVWNSEVANITPAQRLAARVVSKGIPDGASNEKAVEYIKKAVELNPDNQIRYKLDLARHYKRTGEHDKAVQALQESLSIEPKNDIDKWNQDRARELLQELR